MTEARACACPISGVIDLIGKKWTLCVVTTLGNAGSARFHALETALAGISPRTLTDTLRALEAEGLVERQAFAEIPPRVEYKLTKDGAELFSSIQPLMDWSARHQAR